MNDDLPTRSARRARLAGYSGLILAVLSVGLTVLAWPSANLLFVIALICAALAPVAGGLGMAINRNCLAPRPISPLIALVIGLLLAVLYVAAFLFLMSLGNMH